MTSTMLRDTTVVDRPRGTSFPGLVGVELRRLWWRRLAKAVLALTALLTIVSVFSAYQLSSPENVARALDEYTRQAQDIPQMVQECEQAQQQARDAGETTADFGCDEIRAQSLESMGIASPLPGAVFGGLVGVGVMSYAFLAFVLGASFIGAEFSTGSIGTWLTFQPRRIRVGLSKLAASTGGGLAVAATGVGLSGLGAWAIGVVNRPGSDLHLPSGLDVGEPLSHFVLRHVAIIAAAALVGGAVALLARNTGAVVGTAIGYTVVVEGILGQGFLMGKLNPWLLSTNITGFLQRGTTYQSMSCSASRCDSVTVPVSYTHSWLYLAVVAVLLVALSLAVFRRRDVG